MANTYSLARHQIARVANNDPEIIRAFERLFTEVTVNLSTGIAGTLGSILFLGSSGISEDNANLFWDDTNDRLGLGTASPGSQLEISASGAAEILSVLKADAAQTASLTEWQNSAGTVLAAIEALGAIRLPIATITAASATLDASHHTVLCDCSSNAITINLPAVSGISGRIYNIKKTDSTGNKVTIDGDGSETIDGGTTAQILYQYTCLTLHCDGTEWHVI